MAPFAAAANCLKSRVSTRQLGMSGPGSCSLQRALLAALTGKVVNKIIRVARRTMSPLMFAAWAGISLRNIQKGYRNKMEWLFSITIMPT